MADSHVKVILDTNLWISYLISRRLINIDTLLKKGVLKLIFSTESIAEFIDVARRPRFRKFFSEEDIWELLTLLEYYSEMVKVHSEVNVCRDAKDNFLLALAKDSHADYLVTGDKDLLEIEIFESTHIITYATFEKELNPV
jgi:putative PIN family toxin of toxin-antitoxin system